MQQSSEPKYRKSAQEASHAGEVSVAIWDDKSRFDSGLSSWGNGFFDFSRSLNVLNSPGAGYVQGKYDEGFYLLSEKSRDN